ncbi:M1 family metallopeptidase [Parasediminibacterium paludis]|uniref:M1 family metallopeptidase n=1 Tax=Parasediminibacterium paludis TaxID=908966 RepID=A0ABV8PX55_9BACT
MKKLLMMCLLLQAKGFAQSTYWQQDVQYKIDVALNDQDKVLTASETIVYKNNSPETLNFIWFHIWPNAYKNINTALFQQLSTDEERKKKLEKISFGYIDGLSFTINGKPATIEAHPNPTYIDIIKLVLLEPLKPGESITIATPFKVQLPSYFSRSGFADNEIMACQWYPKPAVFDKDGWHEFPYLDYGEFYSEYGTYKVNITVPTDYVVGATGVLQTASELNQYKTLGRANALIRNNKPQLYKADNTAATKTLTYVQDNVPDFGWFADKDLVIQYDTVQLASGKIVDAFSYYHNKKNTLWVNSIDYIKDGTRKYSEWIGEYAYPVVQAIEGPKNNSSGGMEYPTITLITSPDAKKETLDGVIAHEVGHNWFMSMLGSNERAHTWQDEGLNSYFQFRYEAEKYRINSIFGSSLPPALKEKNADDFLAAIYMGLSRIPMEPAIETPADKFANSQDYGLVSYVKAALWMYIIEASTSREVVDRAFHIYFDKWKFKHPQPSDLKAAFEEASGKKMNNLFDLLNKTGSFQ